MTIKVTEEKINEKIKSGEKIIGTKVIKYPHFECEGGKSGEKLCRRMNSFYKDIAQRFSVFCDKKLPQRLRSDSKVRLSMKYMISSSNEKVICVVTDLVFYDGRGAQKKRFSQIWDIKRGDMLPIGEVLKTDLISRRRILFLVLSAADKNEKSGRFGYFNGATSRLRRFFSSCNCFLVHDGVCFFVDAGKISPSGYGAECFLISKNDLAGLLKSDFFDTDVEDCK